MSFLKRYFLVLLIYRPHQDRPTMKKSNKKSKNEEFIEKIKTIGFITGKPSKEDPSICENCGEPMDDHISGLAIPISSETAETLLSLARPVHDEASESSFAA
jgi:hypothetical protein